MKRINDLFNSRAVRKFLLKLRVPLGLAAAALLLTQVQPAWFVPGLIVSVTGALLQLWCFGSIKTQKVLAVRGPYLFVRNPMYLARYLLILGVVLMTGNPLPAIAFTALYIPYMYNRVRREEDKLRALFGEDYEDYCRRVRRFLPLPRRFNTHDLWFFRGEYFARNHGLVNLLTVLVFYAACYVFAFHLKS